MAVRLKKKTTDMEEDPRCMHLTGRMPAIDMTYWMQRWVKTLAGLKTPEGGSILVSKGGSFQFSAEDTVVIRLRKPIHRAKGGLQCPSVAQSREFSLFLYNPNRRIRVQL
jgi:hypothetical protein